MAVKIVSPGVVNRENDQSQIVEGPIIAGGALIGPTVKGPVNEPIIVTSYSDYKSKFGSTFTSGSRTYTYLTSIAAHNYFDQGGVTKARSTQIKTAAIGAIGETGSLLEGRNALLASITQQPSGAVAASYVVTGSGANAPVSSSNFAQRVSMSLTIIGSAASPTVSQITFETGSTNVSPGDTIRVPSQSLGTAGGTVIGEDGDFVGELIITVGADDLITTQSFELSTIPKGNNQNSDTDVKFAVSGSAAASLVQNAFGVLPSGSTDNIRWEIGNVDNSTGNFSLLIRRGDDSTDNKVILEQYLNVNLDPFSPRYIEKVIGNTTLTVRSGSGAGNEYLQITGSYKNNSR